MNRQELFEILKSEGVVKTNQGVCPSDVDLKFMIVHSQVPAKKLIDTLLMIGVKIKNERRPNLPLATENQLPGLL